jgi:DNA-binding transcriptional ArsR family regulator
MAGVENPTRPNRQRLAGLVRPGLSMASMPVVELDSRTGYDFLTSCCNDCGDLEDLLPEDRRWLEEGRTALTAELGTDIVAAGCLGFVSEIGRMLVVRPEIRTARELVAAVDALSDQELLETLLGDLVDSPDFGELTLKTLAGDDAAFADLQGLLEHMKGQPVLFGKVAEVAPAARRVLHAWLPRYEKIEGRIARMIDRDVASRRSDDAVGDPLGFVERTTNGIRLVAEPRIRRIVLGPSYFGRPYNSLSKVGDVQLICYPIADSSLESAGRMAPPAATVRLYRALGDETRLNILRLLAEKDRYLTELANELDLSKPTMSHHLAQLRAASLVTNVQQGNLTYYTLRRDRVREAGPELAAFLAR